jgi:hypothetical protein
MVDKCVFCEKDKADDPLTPVPYTISGILHTAYVHGFCLAMAVGDLKMYRKCVAKVKRAVGC